MHKLFFTVLFVCLTFALNAAEKQKLPPLDTLKELPLKKIADFMDHDDIASPALPVITAKGDLFFYDSKHRQLFKTHIDNQKLTPISRSGEGPKEYTWVIDMMIQEEDLYLIEMKRKVLCFDINGAFKWEKRIQDTIGLAVRLLVEKDGAILLRNSSPGPGDGKTGIYRLGKDSEKLEMIKELPRLIGRINAVVNGKIIKGGGMVPLAEPSFLVSGGNIIASASNNYQFSILDLNGKLRAAISPEIADSKPERTKMHETVSPNTEPYAIKEIFHAGKYIALISNYFVDEKPRIDFFTPGGTIKKSYILPFKTRNNPRTTFTITGQYLVHTDHSEVGFTVYKIL